MHQQTSLVAGAPAGLLPAETAERFAALYSQTHGRLRHDFAEHPLLAPAALAEAALRMDPANVECRIGDARNGEGFDFAADPGRGIPEIIHGIAEAGRWVMLAKLEQLPEYAELFRAIMAPLEPTVRRESGAMLRLQAYVFVSSPGTLTPFHMDPEYNILFQIAGTKDFVVYPTEEPWLGDAVNEHYHASGDNLLSWKAEYRDMGSAYRLLPGDALYVPYKCPHWVEVGAEPSVSLSLTWCTGASYDQEAAWRLNAWLRRRGLVPRPPVSLPARARLKALAWSALERLRVA